MSDPYLTSSERKLLKALVDNGYSHVKSQFTIQCSDSKYTVDFAFTDIKIAVEIDGGNYMCDWRVDNEDKKRDADLENAGWRVYRFVDTEVDDRLPDVITRISEWVTVAKEKTAKV